MNSVLRGYLAFTVPLLLIHFSDPLDFIVYAVGVNFISQIDNITPKRYTIETLDETRVPDDAI